MSQHNDRLKKPNGHLTSQSKYRQMGITLKLRFRRHIVYTIGVIYLVILVSGLETVRTLVLILHWPKRQGKLWISGHARGESARLGFRQFSSKVEVVMHGAKSLVRQSLHSNMVRI